MTFPLGPFRRADPVLRRAILDGTSSMAAEADTLCTSDDDRLQALGLILGAWEEGADRGIAPEMMAYAALYTALTDLIGAYGEDHVSRLCDGLRPRIEKGEFTVRGRPQ
jgi:hypothetical protein